MATMQGYYTADGTNKLIEIPFDANWIKIVNYTQYDAGAGGAGQMIEAYWQTGMPYGEGVLKEATIDAKVSTLLVAANAITPFNSSDSPLGTPEATVITTNAAPVVATVADSSLYPTGSIVRVGRATGCSQIQNLDFTVEYNDGTHIDFANMVAPGAAGNPVTITPLKWDSPWYPQNRSIVSITQAAQAVIAMTVTHAFEIGDTVRLMVPDQFGMVEANLKEVLITDIDITLGTNTITVDLDTTTYTPFAWPANGTRNLAAAEVIPLSGPITNIAHRGFQLVTGAANPGGVANDVIYWVAGDSFGI